MRKMIALLITAAGAMAAGSANAGDVYWSVGISSPGVGTVISNAPPVVVHPAPVYVAPAPVVYAPPPVVYTPPPRVVYRPVPVYTAPRVVYQPVPVVVRGHGHGHYKHYRHHKHHRHHDRHDGGYYDHGGRNIVAVQTVDYSRRRH